MKRNSSKALDQFLAKVDQHGVEQSSLHLSSISDSSLASEIAWIEKLWNEQSVSWNWNESSEEKTLPNTHSNQIGPYRIDQCIGSGGFGAVYLTREQESHRRIAIKLLHHNRELSREKFLREAATLSQLQHPHLVRCFDFGRHENQLYYTMEHVEGSSLARMLSFCQSAKGSQESVRLQALLSKEFILQIALQMAEALALLHRHGLVHCDFKPGNILIDHAGNAKLGDLGLATRMGEPRLHHRVGTVSYMSPEQSRNEEMDSRSDVFSFGATFYEAFSLNRAFAGNSREEICFQIQNAKLSDFSGVPENVRAILTKCLEKDPTHRYANAEELLQQLRKAANGECAVKPQSQSSMSRVRPWALLAAMFLVAGLSVTLLSQSATPDTEPKTDSRTSQGKQVPIASQESIPEEPKILSIPNETDPEPAPEHMLTPPGKPSEIYETIGFVLRTSTGEEYLLLKNVGSAQNPALPDSLIWPSQTFPNIQKAFRFTAAFADDPEQEYFVFVLNSDGSRSVLLAETEKQFNTMRKQMRTAHAYKNALDPVEILSYKEQNGMIEKTSASFNLLNLTFLPEQSKFRLHL